VTKVGYGYDPETKQESLQWNSPQSPRAKKVQQVRSSTKSMLLKRGKNDGITVYIPKETVLKEMAAKIE
jgi:hypothetical protein